SVTNKPVGEAHAARAARSWQLTCEMAVYFAFPSFPGTVPVHGELMASPPCWQSFTKADSNQFHPVGGEQLPPPRHLPLFMLHVPPGQSPAVKQLCPAFEPPWQTPAPLQVGGGDPPPGQF